MIARRAFPPADLGTAFGVAVVVEIALGWALARAGPGRVLANISDERVRPIAVSITPVVDDAPLLKLGTKRDPRKLPDRWQRPRPVERAAAAAFPSPAAPTVPSAIPAVPVADAGQKPPSPETENARQVDQPVEAHDAGPAPVSTVEGAPDGVKEGTEKDPLKAHAADLYRAQLDAWFSARFRIRGKIPFDRLKTLRAGVSASITGDRRVAGFSITSPSGDAVFDGEVAATMSGVQSSGAELPPPPPMYPDILGKSLSLSFRCTARSACE